MIRINDYCSVAFAQWVINRRNFNNLNTLNDQQINELVENYLKESIQKWNLRFFLKLFQDYIIRFDNVILEPKDLITTFEEFCINNESMKFVDPNSVDKRVYIYPLLNNFCTYVNMRTSNRIDNELKFIASISYNNRKGILEWFDEVTKFYSKELSYLFSDYIQDLLSYDFIMFLSWVHKKRKDVFYESTDFGEFSIDFRKRQIIEVIKNGIVEDKMRQRIERSKEGTAYCQFIALTKEYSLLDFIHYLEKKDINIIKEVPKEILEELADEYLSQFPNAEKKPIYDFIRDIRHEKTFFNKLTNKFRNKYGNKFSLERYISCKYHGVFLFRKIDNLSIFLRDFWHDIHIGTGDTIDFYFTDQDVKSDYHCKIWIEKYSNMDIDVKEFPSIFLWEIEGNNKDHILLKGLSHKEIYDVIEYLTAQLESTSFCESISATKIKIKQIKDSKRAKNIYYIANNSQIAAFGEKAISNNNTFEK